MLTALFLAGRLTQDQPFLEYLSGETEQQSSWNTYQIYDKEKKPWFICYHRNKNTCTFP